ncbi:MAG: peroxiredoxin family protein [Acidobacteriota bacterium]|nr:peroxiredoxin family protein [Acidobacteriota bacterium]
MNLRIAGAITLIIGSVACGTRFNSNSSLSGTADLKPRNSPIAVGEMVPDFTLEDHNNGKVMLSSARGSMPAVLVFYRGNW